MTWWERGECRTPLAAAALAVTVALPSLPNGFVYDDLPVIVQNPLVHGLGSFSAVWSSGYWPAGLLYRPLTIQWFGLEWVAGAGRPLVFHLTSILLLAVVTVLLWRLARRFLPPTGAAIAGALFAVHPAHVEVVANAVGQSELLATLLILLAVERYLAWREAGALDLPRRAALAGLTFLAIVSKETGYVTPLLLAGAELCSFRAPRKAIRPAFLLQAGAVLAALLIRLIVLGSLAGETPAVPLQGLGVGARAVGMLAVMPEWARLLFWPARLQGEYGPPALLLVDAPILVHLLGAVLLLLGAALFYWGWRRQRGVAFAGLWIAIAILPVSNLLAATGLLLAERTLFLPSVGAVLLVATAAEILRPRLAQGPRALRLALPALGLALIVAAGVRSAERATVWRTQATFFTRLVLDAPDTYRAHYVTSRFYYGENRYPEAEREARRALTLYRRDVRVHEQLGQVLRAQGRCRDGLDVLGEGVRLAPGETTIRSRLIECLLAVGDTAGARATAEAGVAAGHSEFSATVRRLTPLPSSR